MLIVKRICAQPALRKSEGSLKTEHVGFLRMIHYPHCKNAAKLVHAALAQTESDEGDALTEAAGNNEGAVFKWLSSLVGADVIQNKFNASGMDIPRFAAAPS